jgi:hypothetical protein
MTTVLPFANNVLNLFRYEIFDYTINNPNSSLYSLQFGTVSPQLVPYLVNNGSNVVFSSSVFSASPTSNLVFVINAVTGGGTVALTSSNTVNIGNGRFRDSNGNSLTGGVLTLYQNEPFTPVQFNAPFALSNPIIVTPSLPAGLSFTPVLPYQFDLSGLPTLQTPSSNYFFIGKNVANPSQLVTTSNYTISVGPERIVLSLLGQPTVTMTENQPISFRLVTAAYPPYSTPGGTLQYTWPTLPDGLYFSDLADTPKTSPFVPADAQSSIVLRGTPTSNAVLSFVNANISNYTITLNALRLLPPNISNSLNFTFAFTESIVFDTPNLTPLYIDLSVNSSVSSNSFKASTYFGPSSSVITNIFSPNLIPDLSLTFNSTLSRAFLTGVPRSSNIPGGTFTIRAVTSTGVTTDISANIVVANDAVTFTARPAIDACYNFIVGRPLSSLKTGYYNSNIVFTAVSAAGCNVTFTAPELDDLGINLTQTNGTVVLTGTPTTVAPLTTLNVTATAADTLASAATTIKFEVVPDDFTFTSLSNLTFLQNFPITPTQISATTLSERSISTFSSPNLPEGLVLTSTGILQGTPSNNTNFLDSSFTVVASTGFTTDSQNYTYTIIPDAIAFVPISNVRLVPGEAITPIQIQGFSYSGKTVSNFQLIGLDASYGLTLSSNGILSGTFQGGTYPNTALLSNVLFSVQGTVGNFVGSETFNLLTPSNPSTLRYILGINEAYRTFGNDNYTGGVFGHYVVDDNLEVNQPTATLSLAFPLNPNNLNVIPYNAGYYDIQPRFPELSGYGQGTNLIVFTTNEAYPIVSSNGGASVTQLTGGSDNYVRRLYQVTNKTGTSNWFGVGYVSSNSTIGDQVYLYRSSNGLDWDSIPRQSFTPSVSARYGLFDSVAGGGGYIGGTCLRYKSGVLMYGGGNGGGSANTMLRSVDDGSNWSVVINPFVTETTAYNLDSDIWIAGGSDFYESENWGSTFTGSSATTLKYSTDLGQSWSNVSGGFNFSCTEIEYGNGQWLASGTSYSNGQYFREFRHSSDGSNWALLDLGVTYEGRPLIRNGQTGDFPNFYPKMLFDGFYWTIFMQTINPYVNNSLASSIGYYTDNWRHVNNTSLASGWSNVSAPVDAYLKYVYISNFIVAGQLGPIASTIISNSPQPFSILSTSVGKAVFTDPRL